MGFWTNRGLYGLRQPIALGIGWGEVEGQRAHGDGNPSRTLLVSLGMPLWGLSTGRDQNRRTVGSKNQYPPKLTDEPHLQMCRRQRPGFRCLAAVCAPPCVALSAAASRRLRLCLRGGARYQCQKVGGLAALSAQNKSKMPRGHPKTECQAL